MGERNTRGILGPNRSKGRREITAQTVGERGSSHRNDPMEKGKPKKELDMSPRIPLTIPRSRSATVVRPA